MARPLFLRSAPNPLRGQHEAKITSIRKLNRVRKVGATNSIEVIRRSTSGRIQCSTTRPKRKCRTPIRAVTDDFTQNRRRLRPLAQLGCIPLLFGTERREDVLTIAVPVDIQLDADGIAQLPDVRIKALVLDCVRGLLAAVRLSAGILRGPERVRVPAVFPVAVDVGAEAGLAGRRRGRIRRL